MTSSDLWIGPIKFSHHVQDISIEEHKAVDVLQTTRTSKNLVFDSGSSVQKATVRLLLTGLSEINSELRKLIILFRSCPVISLNNELLTSAWGIVPAKMDSAYLEGTVGTGLKKDSIAVAIENLSLTTVPDIPYAMYVTLLLTRVDITPVFADGSLLYIQEDGSPTEYAVDAFYLNKWLDIAMNGDAVPQLTVSDFDNISISWYGEFADGNPIAPPSSDLSTLYIGDSPHTKVYSESCSIRNLFAYNKFIGKGTPFPQMMGSSARFYSLDIVFTDQNTNLDFDKFVLFKESSDYIARAKDREARIAGWIVKSPVAKLLRESPKDRGVNIGTPGGGAYVPTYVSIENGEQPFTKIVKVDMAETGTDFFRSSNAMLLRGGTDYDGLKRYFDLLCKQETELREQLKTNRAAVAKALTGLSKDNSVSIALDAFSVFWPVVDGQISFSTNETFGVLNKDSLRAAMLNSKFDTSDQLQLALLETTIVAGRQRTGNKLPDFFTRFRVNKEQLQQAVFGVDELGAEGAKVYEIVIKYVNRMFDGGDANTKKLIGKKLFIALLGDYSSTTDVSSESAEVIEMLASSDLKFSTDFLNSLFTTVIERRSPRKDLDRIYSVDSLHASFLKLLLGYNRNYSSLSIGKDDQSSIASTAIEEYFSRSVYEDLLLPRYRELFGDRWEQFAPRYSDLGIINSDSVQESSVESDASLELAVTENDVVPPYIFFFHRKYNTELKSKLSDSSGLVSALGHKLQLSVPFNSSDIKAIEEAAQAVQANRKTNVSLPDVINSAFKNAQAGDPEAFDASMRQLSIAYADEMSKKYFGEDSTALSLYVHSNNNIVYRKLITTPGIAGMLYKTAKDFKYLRTTDTLPQADVDEEHKANGSEYSFLRGLDENTKSILKSDLDQNPDIHENAAKMFPAIKVYLLERRGSDLYGDDSFFSVNPIVSVDITLDKDDADLAIITIADPLYILQNAKFPSSNIARVTSADGSGNIHSKQQVLSSLRGTDAGGYLKRNKIIEGRPVQIRLGYDSMPKNLKTVFTGRIVEIQPGDMLTIVCQGWKAELINNQVSFYNDNVKNWGARDLAIMAIQHANPEGFGDMYPQRSSDYLLKNLQGTDLEEMLGKVLQTQEGVETVEGSRSIPAKIGNSLVEFLGLSSLNKDNKGLDTRLKNIWWPDVPVANNIAHWRYWTTIMPSQMNDSWTVPMQPAWEALKESSRHAWNSIVQVVPYDGEATVFFGHPDQPYYYTKGGSRSKRSWEKYANRRSEALKKSNLLIGGFLVSKEYNTPLDQATAEYVKQAMLTLTSKLSDMGVDILTSESILEELMILVNTVSYLNGSRASEVKEFKNSYKLMENFLISKDSKGDGTIDFFSSLATAGEDAIDFFSSLATGGPAALPGQGTLRLAFSSKLRQILNKSNRFEVAFSSVREKLGHRAVPIILKMFLGIPESEISTQWPEAFSDMPTMMSPQGERVAELMLSRIQASNENIQALREQLRNALETYFDTYLGTLLSQFTYVGVSLARNPVQGILVQQFEAKYSLLRSGIADHDGKLKVNVRRQLEIFEFMVSSFQKAAGERHAVNKKSRYKPNENFYIYVREAYQLIDIRNIVYQIIKESPTTTGDPIALSGLSTSKSLLSLKLFVYFFDKYLSTDEGRTQANEIATSVGNTLPPNMKVFRQHHYIDADHDILRNEIAASTRDMWNTVIVEHPAHAEATSAIGSEDDLFRGGDFFSGIKWVYWPKNEVSGVAGLQFHPGLTLANKKVRIFTELNCQSNELAAKLACVHLAEGIKRMYRGTLLINGRVMKPYDRIVLHDDYTKMTGPLEIESVIHHWSVETGWVTNIAPQAVCDANPGAAILQTAAIEDMFVAAFAITEYAVDAIALAIAIATLGGATSLAPGVFNIKQALAGAMKSLIGSNRNKYILGRITAPFNQAKTLGTIVKNSGLNLKQLIGSLATDYGGLGKAALTAWVGTQAVNQLLHTSFRLTVTSSFVANAQKVEQLPIILAPLLFEGLPFLAGMDTDDPVWAVEANGVFWNLRELNEGMEDFVEQIFGESTVSILESTTK
jgi:hypothetical protein